MAEKRANPMRKCLGCGEMKPKYELLRVVKSSDGKVEIDPSGRKNGRGAYLCHCKDCLENARKARRLERTFSTKISDEMYLALEEVVSKNES